MSMTRFCLSLMLTLGIISAAPAQEGQDGSVEMPEKASLTVLDQGEAPRRALRYDFEIGRTEQFVMLMDFKTSVDMQGRQQTIDMPLMEMAADVSITGRTDEGNFKQKFEFTGANVKQRPQDNQRMVQAMRRQLQGMKGVTGSAVITRRGRTIESKFNVPEGANPAIRQQLSRGQRAVKQASLHLPEKPIGKGARWRVETPFKSSQFNLVQTAVYEVKKLEGDDMTVAVDITQRAPKQQMGGARQVKIESFKSTGKGTMKVNFKRIVPESSIKLNMELEQSMRGRPMKMNMDMQMDLRPGKEDGGE